MKYRISGIPCLIRVLYAHQQAPDPGAHSDWDYHGTTDFEFLVCDRRGRPAPWLERKLTQDDIDGITQQFFNQ